MRVQFTTLRNDALAAIVDVPRFQPDEVYSIIKKLRTSRTVGVDNWHVKELKALSKPQIAKLNLVCSGIYHCCYNSTDRRHASSSPPINFRLHSSDCCA